MFRIPYPISGCGIRCFINISNKNQNRYATLTELIKESLEGKLSDQIRASLEAEGNEMNEATSDFDFSKPIEESTCKSFNSYITKVIKRSFSR